MSCDILPSETEGNHYQGDVMDIIHDGWDLMVAHPPCTFLCNSGVRWLYTRPTRWQDLIEGAMFFRKLLNADIPRIAIENPIMHKWARKIVDCEHDQIIQPWQYGHGETKATCLWLHNLPELQSTWIVPGRDRRIHKMAPGPNRSKERSRFYPLIAKAMAEQWGGQI